MAYAWNKLCILRRRIGAMLPGALKHGIKLVALALFAALPAACGYHLQQPLSMQSSWQPIYVDASGELRRALQSELLENNLALTSKRKNAGSTLSLNAQPIKTRGLSISFDGRDAEILRSLQTQLYWRDKKGHSLADISLYAEQSQLASPGQRAAQQREADALDQLLREDIARQVIEILRYPMEDHASLP
ncbi:MAG: hypothetical protein HKO07_07590 [Pseudomonadales bacterium]|nr:hypothetical protein [Pseudomonadales bacterium]